MNKRLQWGIIGAGNIAAVFARALEESETGKLVAIGSRNQASADTFGETWHVPQRYGSYEQVLADPDVEIVYIATPHPFHAEWAIKAAEAGKHILCEKPIALNQPEARTIIDAARRNDVFLMEAFMYRCHPQIARLLELIRSGTIGDVRVIQAAFSYHASLDSEQWYLYRALAGGAIIDVGSYCTSIARLIAGVATGQDFVEPIDVKAIGHIGERSGTDEYSQALLSFPNNILAYVVTGTQVQLEERVQIYGSKGSITVQNPWTPPAGPASLLLKLNDQKEAQEIIVDAPVGPWTFEVDTVARYLDQRQSPTMSWDDTLGNMHTLDRWRAEIGLVYPQEEASR